MAKGFYTQGICILLEKAIPIAEFSKQLAGFSIRDMQEQSSDWMFRGPSFVVDYAPDTNGCVIVDVIDREWPDDMGDPQQNVSLFAAWSMGNFGPYSFPGGLQRASEHSWAWESGREIAKRHHAFIRLRLTYALGVDENEAIVPEEYDPEDELYFLMKLASALFEHPSAICYFNPNGEVLRDQDTLREGLNYGWANDLPPLDMWCNVRLFNIDEEWVMMDTVGNSQVDVLDCEACFRSQSYDFNEVDNFLRNLTLYQMSHDETIETGDTIDGPGDTVWIAECMEDGLCEPPRNVVRWLPDDEHEVPALLMSDEEENEDEDEDGEGDDDDAEVDDDEVNDDEVEDLDDESASTHEAFDELEELEPPDELEKQDDDRSEGEIKT